MAKGRIDEAEYLLKNALSHYPREALMDGAQNIDSLVRDSYETLFTDIKLQKEIVDSLKGRPTQEKQQDDLDILKPESRHSGLYTKLQDVVMRNIEKQRIHLQRDGKEPLPPMPDFSFEEDVSDTLPRQEKSQLPETTPEAEPVIATAKDDVTTSSSAEEPVAGEMKTTVPEPAVDEQVTEESADDGTQADKTAEDAAADDLIAAIADASVDMDEDSRPTPEIDTAPEDTFDSDTEPIVRFESVDTDEDAETETPETDVEPTAAQAPSEDEQIKATVEEVLERQVAAEREEHEKLPDETVEASLQVASNIAKSLNREPDVENIELFANNEKSESEQDTAYTEQTSKEAEQAAQEETVGQERDRQQDAAPDDFDLLVEKKEPDADPTAHTATQTPEEKEEFPQLEPISEKDIIADKIRQPAGQESIDALAEAAGEAGEDDEEEILKFEEETQKKPGFFTEIKNRLSYIFARSKKTGDEEPDATAADTSETHKPEELQTKSEQQAETAGDPAGVDMTDEQIPEAGETQTGQENTAQSSSDEVLEAPPGGYEQQGDPAAGTIQLDDDDGDEALLSDEELAAQKTPPKREPVITREFNLPNTIATLTMMLLFVALSFAVYSLYGLTRQTSELNKVYQQAEKAAEEGNIDKAVVSLSQYIDMLEVNSDKKAVTASIIAGWGSTLREKNNPNDAVRLMTMFQRKGVTSQAVSEELLGALIARSAGSFSAKDFKSAEEDIETAGSILDSVGINQARAGFFRQQIAGQAYVIYTHKTSDRLAKNMPAEAYAALKSLKQYEPYLNAGLLANIHSQVRKTADALARKAKIKLAAGKKAQAKDLAQKALELDPKLRQAKNVLRRAK